MRPIATLSLVALLAACTEPVAGPATLPPFDVVGCYQLDLTRWSGAHEAPDPPAYVVLTDSVGSFLLEASQPLVRPAPGYSAATFGYMAWWRRPVRDTLEVVFTTGYVGVSLRLAWRGDAWVGVGEAFTDVAPPIQARSAARLAPSRTTICGYR